MPLITLMADPSRTAPKHAFRLIERGDAASLGDLYFAAYEPGVACDTRQEAIADIRATVAGEYGRLLPEACLVVGDEPRRPMAAVFTVDRAPWDDTPDCPFVIELFTDPGHRRQGLARALMTEVLAVCGERGEGVALRVDDENDAARGLYRSLGFVEWSPR